MERCNRQPHPDADRAPELGDDPRVLAGRCADRVRQLSGGLDLGSRHRSAIAAALRAGKLVPLAGYPILRREVPFGRSRLDFRLDAPDRAPCLVEVKSITLVIDGLGCFPDAVTARGRRHLEELAGAVDEGYRAAVVFVVQRDDAVGVRPHDESDPDFGRTLRESARHGVEVYACGCCVEPARVAIERVLPVHLEPPPGESA